tara:strand:- start:112 stop:276 length:165 start_codon:yes stop_codon:yes gene_type:complete
VKIVNSNNLENSIRDALNSQRGRCLDDREDFDAVMTALKTVVDKWMKNRCAGCK